MKKVLLMILTAIIVSTVSAACAITGVKERPVFTGDPAVLAEAWDAQDAVAPTERKESSGSFSVVNPVIDASFMTDKGLRFTLPFGDGAFVSSALPDDATEISLGVVMVPAANLSGNWQGEFVSGNTFVKTGHSVYESFMGEVFADKAAVGGYSSLGAVAIATLQERNYETDISVRGVIRYTSAGEVKYLYADSYVSAIRWDLPTRLFPL